MSSVLCHATVVSLCQRRVLYSLELHFILHEHGGLDETDCMWQH